jgi:nitrite reductase/ring-hydroxylating ferredoxin subunit
VSCHCEAESGTTNLLRREVMRRNRDGLLLLGGLLMVLALGGCTATADSTTPVTTTSVNGPISGTWIDIEVEGDTIVLPVSEVTEAGNVHFSLSVAERRLDFMAYALDGVLHVRANACPPCHSRGFALDGSILVCDMCQTTFEAVDGSGIEGACVAYPKAAVDYAIDDDLIVMETEALVAAYDETLVAG